MSNYCGLGLAFLGGRWPGTGINLTIGFCGFGLERLWRRCKSFVELSPGPSPADEEVGLGEVANQPRCLIPCRESGGSCGHSGGPWPCAGGGTLSTADP